MKEAHSTPRSIKLIEDFEELFPNDPGTLQLHTEIYSMSTHTQCPTIIAASVVFVETQS